MSSEFGVLGPLAISVDGEAIEPGGRKQQTLLGLLALHAPDDVSTDVILEAMWGERIPDRALHTLHTHISTARRIVEPTGATIGKTDGGYRLEVAPGCVDLHRFRQMVDEGMSLATENPRRAIDVLNEALALWRSARVLGQFDAEPWVAPIGREAADLRLRAEIAVIDALIACAENDDAVVRLERLLTREEFREDLWSRLMIVLYRSGRQSDALAAFQRARRALGDELGLEPGPELARLEEQILLQEPDLLAGTDRNSSIPALRSSLLGRQAAHDHVSRLLDTERVVTLVGPGGVGKTTLAVAVARSVSKPAWFCDLVPVGDGGVAQAVAAALGLPVDDPGRSSERVERWIGNTRALLLVDNCEHVLVESAELVDRLWRACPELTVLATSRQPLGLTGERVVPVAPLEPDAAVELLRDRADRVSAELGDDEEKLTALCERLDHLPLAIELVAGRLSHLTVDEILGRLEETIAVVASPRADDRRHSTLEATLEWSYQLLDDVEAAALRAASVFVGVFDVTGISALVGVSQMEALDVIGSLVSRSLVIADRVGAATRYRLLETVRTFASDKVQEVDESASLVRAHAEHFLQRSVGRAPHPPDRHPWRHLLVFDPHASVDAANHIQALKWLLARERTVDAARLHARMIALDQYGSHDQERRILENEDVAAMLTDLEERALYLTASAINANALGRWTETVEFGVAAVEVDADPHCTAIGAGLAAQLSWSDPDRVAALLRKGHERLPADSVQLDRFLRERRADTLIHEDPEEAIGLLESLHAEGSPWAAFELLVGYHIVDRSDEVELHITRMTEAERASQFAFRIPLGRALARVASADGREARAQLVRAGREAFRYPDNLFERDVLVGCAALAVSEDRVEHASMLLAAVNGTTRTPASFALYARYRDITRGRLRSERVTEIRSTMGRRSPAAVLGEELEALETT